MLSVTTKCPSAARQGLPCTAPSLPRPVLQQRRTLPSSSSSSSSSSSRNSVPGPAKRQLCPPACAIKKQDADSDTLLSSVKAFTQLTQRYDFVSSGVGALCVTSFFVMKGQDPGHALMITGASSIIALVLNELLFSDQQ